MYITQQDGYACCTHVHNSTRWMRILYGHACVHCIHAGHSVSSKEARFLRSLNGKTILKFILMGCWDWRPELNGVYLTCVRYSLLDISHLQISPKCMADIFCDDTEFQKPESCQALSKARPGIAFSSTSSVRLSIIPTSGTVDCCYRITFLLRHTHNVHRALR